MKKIPDILFWSATRVNYYGKHDLDIKMNVLLASHLVAREFEVIGTPNGDLLHLSTHRTF